MSYSEVFKDLRKITNTSRRNSHKQKTGHSPSESANKDAQEKFGELLSTTSGQPQYSALVLWNKARYLANTTPPNLRGAAASYAQAGRILLQIEVDKYTRGEYTNDQCLHLGLVCYSLGVEIYCAEDVSSGGPSEVTTTAAELCSFVAGQLSLLKCHQSAAQWYLQAGDIQAQTNQQHRGSLSDTSPPPTPSTATASHQRHLPPHTRSPMRDRSGSVLSSLDGFSTTGTGGGGSGTQQSRATQLGVAASSSCHYLQVSLCCEWWLKAVDEFLQIMDIPAMIDTLERVIKCCPQCPQNSLLIPHMLQAGRTLVLCFLVQKVTDFARRAFDALVAYMENVGLLPSPSTQAPQASVPIMPTTPLSAAPFGAGGDKAIGGPVALLAHAHPFTLGLAPPASHTSSSSCLGSNLVAYLQHLPLLQLLVDECDQGDVNGVDVVVQQYQLEFHPTDNYTDIALLETISSAYRNPQYLTNNKNKAAQ